MRVATKQKAYLEMGLVEGIMGPIGQRRQTRLVGARIEPLAFQLAVFQLVLLLDLSRGHSPTFAHTYFQLETRGAC